jgi:triacylglycerol esterase/lipase EstA (alpha/beta hydrolase family)
MESISRLVERGYEVSCAQHWVQSERFRTQKAQQQAAQPFRLPWFAAVLMLRSTMVFLLATAGVAFPTAANALSRDIPIVFVHGFCANSGTWNRMTSELQRLYPVTYGNVSPIRLYVNSQFQVRQSMLLDGSPLRSELQPQVPTDARMFTIDFSDRSGTSFDLLQVANASVTYKAYELKRVIDLIKKATGQPQVILVGHSLGGVVARTYVQNLADWVSYGNDVTRVITIDSPHEGTTWAISSIALSWPLSLKPAAACISNPSTNKTEMVPTWGFVPNVLGSLALPRTPDFVSIASYQGEKSKGDWIVSYNSQNLRHLYPDAPNVEEIENPILGGSTNFALHMQVHQYQETINWVHLKILQVDRRQRADIRWEFNTAGNAEGFSGVNVAASLVQNGSYFMDPAGNDPYVIAPTIRHYASAYPYIRTRFGSNGMDSTGAIYFRTTEEDFYSEDKKVTFSVLNCAACGNAPYYAYSIRMNANWKWRGTITGIRLDPTGRGLPGTNKDSIGIDYIRLSANP